MCNNRLSKRRGVFISMPCTLLHGIPLWDHTQYWLVTHETAVGEDNLEDQLLTAEILDEAPFRS